MPEGAVPTGKPAWLKVRVPGAGAHADVQRLMRGMRLNTVCEQAHCPNRGECWAAGTATFLILGEVCTRACSFCAVSHGRPPAAPEADEPLRVGQAVASLGLRHAVVTSVSRDDLADGGASHFAACVQEIRRSAPGVSVEVLIPDFRGDAQALETVLRSRPDVLNHNIETVPRLYPSVRPAARYGRSLDVLRGAHAAGLLAKSGLMLGLGEGPNEVRETLADLRAAGVVALTVGQYLRPTRAHTPVERYYTPAEFDEIAREAAAMGFRHVESGPLVRSSYHAREQTLRLALAGARA